MEHPLFLGVLFSVILPCVLGASSVWYGQRDTVKEIESIKTTQQATAARVDTNKQESQRDLKELRKEVVTKEVLDEKWKTVDKIDRTVDELLRIQIKERR